jgi:hypothetical protein
MNIEILDIGKNYFFIDKKEIKQGYIIEYSINGKIGKEKAEFYKLRVWNKEDNDYSGMDICERTELFETYIEAKKRLKQILESEAQINFNQFKTEF